MAIPILYTGKNVAVPDFSRFTQNAEQRIMQLKQQQENKRRFKIARQDRLNKQFLDTVSLDQVSFVNDAMKFKAADVYQGTEQELSNLLKENEGEPNLSVMLEGKRIANKANQQLKILKNWEENWKADMQVMSDPEKSANYDMEAARENVFGYDGNTPYNSSRLRLRSKGFEETTETIATDLKNADQLSYDTYQAGLGNVKKFVDYQKLYYKVEDGRVTPRHKAQLDYVRSKFENPEFITNLAGIQEKFNSLDEKEQNRYAQLAKNWDGTEQDAPLAYYLSQEGEKLFPLSVRTRPITKNGSGGGTTKTPDIIDLTGKTALSLATDPIDVSGEITYIDPETGERNTAQVGNNGFRITDFEVRQDPSDPEGEPRWMAVGFVPAEAESVSFKDYELGKGATEEQQEAAFQRYAYDLMSAQDSGDKTVYVPLKDIIPKISREYNIQGAKVPEGVDFSDIYK